MINLDEEEIIQGKNETLISFENKMINLNKIAINEILGRESRRALRKLVRLELTKTEKFEARILVKKKF